MADKPISMLGYSSILPEDTTPEAWTHYQEVAKANGVNGNFTVYYNRSASDDPLTYFDKERNAIIINQTEFKPSAESIRKSRLSDATIAEYVKSKFYVPITQDNLADANMETGVYSKYLAMAVNMNLPYTPKIYLSPPDASGNSTLAQAKMSSDGTMYLLIDPTFKTASSVEQTDALGHELGHQALGHTTPESEASASADYTFAISKAQETAADRIGEGVQGSCDPLGWIKHLTEVQKHNEDVFYLMHPDKVREKNNTDFLAYMANFDKVHPAYDKRVADLEAEAQELENLPGDPCHIRPHNTPAVKKSAAKPFPDHS